MIYNHDKFFDLLSKLNNKILSQFTCEVLSKIIKFTKNKNLKSLCDKIILDKKFGIVSYYKSLPIKGNNKSIQNNIASALNRAMKPSNVRNTSNFVDYAVNAGLGWNVIANILKDIINSEMLKTYELKPTNTSFVSSEEIKQIIKYQKDNLFEFVPLLDRLQDFGISFNKNFVIEYKHNLDLLTVWISLNYD